MNRAGFVLVGGRSSRMGRDKAFLPYGATVLAEHVAHEVERVTGSVVLVGEPERYQTLGRRVVADLRRGRGPLAGIETALTETTADWNLIVACDLPGVSARWLSRLLEMPAEAEADCLVPVSPAGRIQPLCAVYHRRCRPVVTENLDRGINQVKTVLAEFRTAYWQAPAEEWFENLNSVADWDRHWATRSAKTAS